MRPTRLLFAWPPLILLLLSLPLLLLLASACGGTEPHGESAAALAGDENPQIDSAAIVLLDPLRPSRPWEMMIDPRAIYAHGQEIGGMFIVTVRDFGQQCSGCALPPSAPSGWVELMLIQDLGQAELRVGAGFLALDLSRPLFHGSLMHQGPALWLLGGEGQEVQVMITGTLTPYRIDWRVEVSGLDSAASQAGQAGQTVRVLLVTGRPIVPPWLKERLPRGQGPG